MSENKTVDRVCEKCGSEFKARRSMVKVGYGRFCSRECRPMPTRPRKDPEVRFWEKVEKGEDCWIWTGCKATGGYGTIFVPDNRRKNTMAHRYSWILHYGEIPEGIFICHLCDNPPCVNPKHLFMGTAADNSKDKWEKGRQGKIGKPPLGLSKDEMKQRRKEYKTEYDRKIKEDGYKPKEKGRYRSKHYWLMKLRDEDPHS